MGLRRLRTGGFVPPPHTHLQDKHPPKKIITKNDCYNFHVLPLLQTQSDMLWLRIRWTKGLKGWTHPRTLQLWDLQQSSPPRVSWRHSMGRKEAVPIPLGSSALHRKPTSTAGSLQAAPTTWMGSALPWWLSEKVKRWTHNLSAGQAIRRPTPAPKPQLHYSLHTRSPCQALRASPLATAGGLLPWQ